MIKPVVNYLLCCGSSETVSFFLPLALRAARTLRPFAVAILSLKPCLFFLFLFDGWNVLFIFVFFNVPLARCCFMCYFQAFMPYSSPHHIHLFSQNRTAKLKQFSFFQNTFYLIYQNFTNKPENKGYILIKNILQRKNWRLGVIWYFFCIPWSPHPAFRLSDK